MAVPEARASRQPRFPQAQRGPVDWIVTWPSSPPAPCAPHIRRPCVITPPPIPVPSATNSRWSTSLPEAELAPGGGVGVVLEREGEPDPRLQLVFQGDALHGVQIWGEDNSVLFREDEASDGQAHPANLEPVLDLQDGAGDALHQASGRSWCRVARLFEDPTLRRDHPGGDLGPSHVHPYGVQPDLQSTTSSSACPEYRLR